MAPVSLTIALMEGACLLLSRLPVSKRVRFDAHRPQCKHTIILVWALGEHKRPTGCPLSSCARWASKGSCLAHPFTILRSQAAIGPCGLTTRRSGGAIRASFIALSPTACRRSRNASSGPTMMASPFRLSMQPFQFWLERSEHLLAYDRAVLAA